MHVCVTARMSASAWQVLGLVIWAGNTSPSPSGGPGMGRKVALAGMAHADSRAPPATATARRCLLLTIHPVHSMLVSLTR